MECPYGGYCIDPAYPSDCEINDHCFNFRSSEERLEWDKKPYRYYFMEKEGNLIKFKNSTQLEFFLNDLPRHRSEEASWGEIPPPEVMEWMLKNDEKPPNKALAKLLEEMEGHSSPQPE